MGNRIAFVVSGKSPKKMPGGLGAYAFNTARILGEMGYQVYIIAFADKDEEVDLEFARLIHVRTPFNRLVSLGLFLISPYLTRAMEKVLREARTASEVVVYGAGLWGKAGVALHRRHPEMPIKTYVGYFSTFQHDSWGQVLGAPLKDYGLRSFLFVWAVYLVSKWVFRPIEHRMLRASHKVVVHYESTRQILLREVRGLDPHKIEKLPYYVDIYERSSDTRFVADLIRQPDWPTIGVICRQDPRKGINTFLHAVAKLYKRGLNFNCLVVGSGIFWEQNRSLATRLGIADRVVFPGFVEAVEPVLAALDVYVLPSVEEGSGAISLLEAMKKGVAIVTTQCDGIPEDFVDGETGLLVPMGDADAMAGALERLVRSPDLRRELAENVRADYPRRFQFDKMRLGLTELVAGRPA